MSLRSFLQVRQFTTPVSASGKYVRLWLFLCPYLSPESQVGEEGEGQEDGRDSTADVGDKGEDGGVQLVADGLPGEVLEGRTSVREWPKNRTRRETVCKHFGSSPAG